MSSYVSEYVELKHYTSCFCSGSYYAQKTGIMKFMIIFHLHLSAFSHSIQNIIFSQLVNLIVPVKARSHQSGRRGQIVEAVDSDDGAADDVDDMIERSARTRRCRGRNAGQPIRWLPILRPLLPPQLLPPPPAATWRGSRPSSSSPLNAEELPEVKKYIFKKIAF
jgi:hypothetical protein